MSAYWIRLGGWLPASEIAAHTPPTWETLADGGNGVASWEVGGTGKVAHQLLAPGTLAQIMLGALPVWTGRIADYDRADGQVSGRGIHVDAQHIPALDSLGAATRDTFVATTVAYGSPWRWYVSNPNGVGGTVLGDATDPVMVAELYDQYATQEGKRWGQDGAGALYLTTDPTVPQWLTVGDSAMFGATSEGAANVLVGRYFDGTQNLTTIRSAVGGGANGVGETVDLTGRGTLTTSQANGILDAALGAQRTGNGWVNGVELTREQLTTMGGAPAHLASVRAGQMVRAHGIGYGFAAHGAPYLDTVIGKTRYTAGDESIYIEPVDTAPRNLVDVLAAI